VTGKAQVSYHKFSYGLSNASGAPSFGTVIAAQLGRSLALVMNKKEARDILATKLEQYRKFSYEHLTQKVDQRSDRYKITGSSGVLYQVVIRVVWDDKPHEDVRVLGCIDDGGWRAFFPVGDSFIVAADGSFVGE
jgi:hypothetical protein